MADVYITKIDQGTDPLEYDRILPWRVQTTALANGCRLLHALKSKNDNERICLGFIPTLRFEHSAALLMLRDSTMQFPDVNPGCVAHAFCINHK